MKLAIASSRYQGLMPQDFHWPELDSLRQIVTTESEMIRTELLLSDAFVTMTWQLKQGRIAPVNWNSKDTTIYALFSSVKATGKVNSILRTQEPIHIQYDRLKTALRLVLDTLSFETRHRVLLGEVSDSLLGFKEIRAIEINLERWRQVASSLPATYLMVTIPAFKAEVWKEGKISWSSRVIVGTPETPTPELAGAIECIVTYPYWNVPRKIAIEEYLPILQKGTDFLTRSNMDVFNHRGVMLNPDSVPWKDFTTDYFPVSIRQREGPDNSLGLIKFVFENPYAVYLHDTNSKKRFSDSYRALSHGCVRVEKATELAHYLTTGSLTRKSKLVQRYLTLEEHRFINLPKPFPIYLRYFTCEWNEGRLMLYPDIYNKDAALAAQLYHTPCAQ